MISDVNTQMIKGMEYLAIKLVPYSGMEVNCYGGNKNILYMYN